MEKFLILSDIHMCGQGQTIKGMDPYAKLRAALDQAAQRHTDVRHAILLGDIAHSGELAEYIRVRELLADYSFDFTYMAGNHDQRGALRAAFPEAAVDQNGFLQTHLDIGATRVLTLDTLQEPHAVGNWYSGYLCQDRMAWLRSELDRADDLRVLILTHHPPVDIGIPRMDRIRLNNGAELISLLQDYPNVAHLICGHVHRTVSGSIGGLGFTLLKSTARQLSFGHESGNKEPYPAPGAYGVVFLSESAVAVHSEDV